MACKGSLLTALLDCGGGRRGGGESIGRGASALVVEGTSNVLEWWSCWIPFESENKYLSSFCSAGMGGAGGKFANLEAER